MAEASGNTGATGASGAVTQQQTSPAGKQGATSTVPSAPKQPSPATEYKFGEEVIKVDENWVKEARDIKAKYQADQARAKHHDSIARKNREQFNKLKQAADALKSKQTTHKEVQDWNSMSDEQRHELAVKFMENTIEDKKLTPEQREARQYKAELERLQKAEAERENQTKAQALQAEQAQLFNDYSIAVIRELEKNSLLKLTRDANGQIVGNADPRVVHRALDLAADMLDIGREATPAEVIELVKLERQEDQERMREMIHSNMSDDEFCEMLGPKGVQRVLKAAATKLKGRQQHFGVKPAVQKKPTAPMAPSRYRTADEIAVGLDQKLRGVK